MSEEKKAILEMLKNGKISVEEAMKLIDSIDVEPDNKPDIKSNNKKFIRIQVFSKDDEDDDGETKVKINIPLNLAKTMLNMNLIKNQISMNASDIDIDFDEIITLIENDAEGEIVNVESNTARVLIKID